MNAVEKLEAAIDKLEALKRARFIYSGWLCELGPDGEAVGLSGHEDDMVPYRTIDAQLDTLRLTSAFVSSGVNGGDAAEAFADLAVALADAVLGES